MAYQHTQLGRLILFSLLFVVLFFGLTMSQTEFPFGVPFVEISILLILASFSTLTVTVDEKFLRLKFGYGIFRKSFPLNEIISAKTVKNPWYYGWGIHLTPRGWLFNVSGFQAVEIIMKNGRVYRIGTDEPEKLMVAISLSFK